MIKPWFCNMEWHINLDYVLLKIILEEHYALGQVFKNTLRNKVTVYILQ